MVLCTEKFDSQWPAHGFPPLVALINPEQSLSKKAILQNV
jgi:hypothetical protein